MKLPAWVGNGVEVSPLAYWIVCDGISGCETTVGALAERNNVDEADVLRALAELARKGVLVK